MALMVPDRCSTPAGCDESREDLRRPHHRRDSISSAMLDEMWPHTNISLILPQELVPYASEALGEPATRVVVFPSAFFCKPDQPAV